MRNSDALAFLTGRAQAGFREHMVFLLRDPRGRLARASTIGP
jgi:hypothetical protein